MVGGKERKKKRGKGEAGVCFMEQTDLCTLSELLQWNMTCRRKRRQGRAVFAMFDNGRLLLKVAVSGQLTSAKPESNPQSFFSFISYTLVVH